MKKEKEFCDLALHGFWLIAALADMIDRVNSARIDVACYRTKELDT